MKMTLIIILLAILFFCGCERRTEQSPPQKVNSNVVLKVSILQSGKLFVDSTEISLKDLETRMKEIKGKNGVMWYYREDDQGDPPPVVIDVMKLIEKHKMTISLSSKSDFSDVIDEKGNSVPRK